jgi:serine/threonine protein kinase
MGEVYRARDTELERDVAIKVLPEAVAQNPDRLERFRREAKAVAKLAHPNILEIWDYGIEGDTTYSVTELLEGETLRERLEGGTIGWRKATEIGAAIADGLAAAHQAGIVHRDLKPSNVFLTADGRVKVLDFGLARHQPIAARPDEAEAPTLSRHTDPGTVLGTIGYMSPEQVKGDPVDGRSDIFSLGCVLYEIVAGQRAFTGNTAVETMNAILKDEPPDISTSGEALPPERFQSASDLAYNLRSLSSASAAPPVRPERRSVGRPKPALWLSLAAVVAVALVWLNPGGWRSTLLRPGGSAASGSIDSLAVLPFVDIGGDEDTEYLSDGIPASIIERLSKLSALRVVPRSTAFHFRGPDQDLADVGRQLGVNAILTGEIRARGERLVIRVELVDVLTDRQLWGERLTGTLDDILATEERIAIRVSESLRVELSGEDLEHLARRGTSSPEAHRHYLRGRYHSLQKGDRELLGGDRGRPRLCPGLLRPGLQLVAPR